MIALLWALGTCGPVVALWPLFIAIVRRTLEARKPRVVQRYKAKYEILTRGQSDDQVYENAIEWHPSVLPWSICLGFGMALIWPISLIGIWAYHKSLEIEL